MKNNQNLWTFGIFSSLEYPKFLGIMGMGVGIVPTQFEYYGNGCG
jgi:hypothetical protein